MTSTTAPNGNTHNGGGNGSGGGDAAGAEVPRPKRIACVLCRKRKLRCDGLRPSCATCSRLGHDCAYDEVRRKSGPKRGYVKALEARLAQVETLLKDQNGSEEHSPQDSQTSRQNMIDIPHDQGMPLFGTGNCESTGVRPSASMRFPPAAGPSDVGTSTSPETESEKLVQSGWRTVAGLVARCSIPRDGNWDMVSMGVEETLPPQDIIDALNIIYFDKIHPPLPIIHRARHYADLELAPALRPKIGLRYAMWAMASSVSEEYSHMQSNFYRLARKYLEEAELRGYGENTISLNMSQAWSLLACYELKLMMFPRAWMSTGRAVRLAQMKGLHVLDGNNNLEIKQCLQPPKDWIDKEERRRTFWSAFCLDRYASMGTGWPMIIDERDIVTNLPASDESFEHNVETKTLSIKEALTPEGAASLTPYGGVALMAVLFGRNLTHLHRPDVDKKDNNLFGEFWKRHRNLDNILAGISMALPSHFRLPSGIQNVNIIFTNMNIHTSTICLHQAAIFKADQNGMSAEVVSGSKIRCITAAAEIASIMRVICHQDLSGMNPFISFCLYVAARVFIQYLKSRPGDEQVRASLQFLLTAMGHMKKLNPLTESFLVQLDIDLKNNTKNNTITSSDDSDSHKRPFDGSRFSVSTSEEERIRRKNACPGAAAPFSPSPSIHGMSPGGFPNPQVYYCSASPDSSNHQSPDSMGGVDTATPPSQSDGSYHQQHEPPDYFDPGVLMDDSMADQFGMGMGEKDWGFYGMEGGTFEQELGSLGNADSDGLLLPGVAGMGHELGDYFAEGMV